MTHIFLRDDKFFAFKQIASNFRDIQTLIALNQKKELAPKVGSVRLVSERLLTCANTKEDMMDITSRQMEILQAAIRVIAQQGYEKLTTKNLAKSIGISDAALYRHFSSKKELVTMILCYFEDISCSVIHRINSQNLNPLEKLSHFVMDRYKLFTRDPDLAMVMFSEELFKNDHSFEEQLLSIMHIHRNEVMGYIREGQSMGLICSELNPLHIFRMVVGSMRLLVSQWNMSKHAFDLVEEGRSLLNTIIKLIEVQK
ncbi:MAG: TetR family transcriptional regulator [Candidatus Cloacimonetes bacterium]|jgi:AcrR family transcriptional regulator|nr:TetR family transcriptional regulator [Candidatus Cloacimonadota bacterium]MDD2507284.1 TetR family transcriptional regulator [Candidatus Cloacimonadota bacterium]MDD4148183.1 TetR family transcriptional regulator [Candidatus Cloacimonadota bacterium]MDD4560698.1 TetR family transcriptional regulator [Candidatus Cloacimonadota bacterium]